MKVGTSVYLLYFDCCLKKNGCLIQNAPEFVMSAKKESHFRNKLSYSILTKNYEYNYYVYLEQHKPTTRS